MMKRTYTNHQRPPRGQPHPLGSVECLLCGRRFMSLAAHLKTHRVTAVEYRKRFPGAATVCHEARERMVNAGHEGNEILRRLGYKHRTDRRFFRDPRRVARERQNEGTDTGTEPGTSDESRQSKAAAA